MRLFNYIAMAVKVDFIKQDVLMFFLIAAVDYMKFRIVTPFSPKTEGGN